MLEKHILNVFKFPVSQLSMLYYYLELSNPVFTITNPLNVRVPLWACAKCPFHSRTRSHGFLFIIIPEFKEVYAIRYQIVIRITYQAQQ